MKVDFEDIARSRAKSFTRIANGISNAQNTVASASASHKKAAESSSLGVMNQWLEYVSTKEYERGHASGYSQACDHMLKVLDQLVSEVKSEFTMLETAIEEFKSVQNLVGEGEEEVPLD